MRLRTKILQWLLCFQQTELNIYLKQFFLLFQTSCGKCAADRLICSIVHIFNVRLFRLHDSVFHVVFLVVFPSYVNGRSFSVSINRFRSTGIKIQSGVPQGSVLGPLVFNLCIFLLGNMINNTNYHHSHTDYTQLHLSFSSNNLISIHKLTRSNDDINCCLNTSQN